LRHDLLLALTEQRFIAVGYIVPKDSPAQTFSDLKGKGGVWRPGLVWPQVLPRLLDVALYCWEHNLRAATTLGVVEAGGLGLEIVTAFHLFEYQEASALILVLLGLVSLINIFGARIRTVFLDGATE